MTLGERDSNLLSFTNLAWHSCSQTSKTTFMAEKFLNHGMGWRPDLPNHKDYDETTDSVPTRLKGYPNVLSIKEITKRLGLGPERLESIKLNQKIDLREGCSPIEDQEALGSCTAHAGVGLLEYYERRRYRKHIDASRLFLYKATRNLLGWTGDTGAYMRTTMAAMALFGVPPEEYWEYNITDFDEEPSAFCYSFGQNYQALQYYRLDKPGISRESLLHSIKVRLKHKLPMAFGFTVFSSIEQAGDTGMIPLPCPRDRVIGGHAVMAVGYNDKLEIHNENCEEASTVGALIIRNSWGTEWGDNGYGYLPYEYILYRLAIDWWSLIKAEWFDLDESE